MLRVNMTFYLAFRTGVNQRFADPSLTWMQVAGRRIVGADVRGLPLRPANAACALMMCLVVLSFGAFRFDTREFLTAAGCGPRRLRPA